MKRLAIGIIAVALVVGVAVAAGVFVFRGVVGSEFALRDSDANGALVAPREGDPSYTLIVAELGSVAAPLDNGTPDVMLLARLDTKSNSLALINVPVGLQITSDNRSESIGSLANKGDAQLITTLAQYAKVDIAHLVKVDEAGLVDMVDKLGGVSVDIEQQIDDPQAGSVYLPKGERALKGDEMLTYLRATNVKYGVEDRLVHQLTFATGLLEKLFSAQGSFTTRLDSIGEDFQTDYALGQLETANKSIGGISSGDITVSILPGYFTAVTNVTGSDSERYVGSANDVATLIDDLNNGREPSVGSITEKSLADPASFTVDVQNGTTVVGAAASAAELLRQNGFNVGDVGNAEQPVYDETLVVYKNSENGIACANAVINTIGAGRAVQSNSYYNFSHDVLLILGADNKPVS